MSRNSEVREVPEPTPEVAGRSPRPGSRFLSEVLAANIQALRLLRRLKQGDLADGMTRVGHRWTQQTVSDVERARRNITVNELLGLALVLDATLDELLDPMGVNGREWRELDYGPGTISASDARAWVRGEHRVSLVEDGRSFRISPRHAPPGVGLVTGPDQLTPPEDDR
jgi:transcriptional regulator with XRE-family HTH domain